MAEEYGVNVPGKGVFVNADLNTLVSAVHLAPSVNSEFRQRVSKSITSHGFSFTVKQSEMDDEALF